MKWRTVGRRSMPADAIWKTDSESLIRGLDLIAEIDESDRAALEALPLHPATVEPGEDFVRQGDMPKECCLLVEGFACRYKTMSRGQRQILSFHLPGDVPDLQSLYLEKMDHGLSALSRCRVAYIPHQALRDLIRNRPGICAALWKSTLVDAAIFREWLAGVGRRTAGQRMAHLFCEIMTRMRVRGIATARTYHLPITQADLADALGLSPVHVNRTLQELRRAGLITSRGKHFAVEDWDRLCAYGDFDPDYLQLRRSALPEMA